MRSNALLFALAALAAAWGYRRFLNPADPLPSWGDGQDWVDFLRVYDGIAAEKLGDLCEGKMLHTDFGETHAFICGDAANPPVVMLHGVLQTSLMYAPWLLPDLVRAGHYVIALDYVCDVGRSLPKNSTGTLSCPATEEDFTPWLRDALAGIEGLDGRPVSIVGYSYGAFIAASVAARDPERQIIDKIALVAPAGVFAPASMMWLAYMLFSIFIYDGEKGHLFVEFMSGDPNFDYERDIPEELRRLPVAAKSVAVYYSMGGAPVPRQFSVEEVCVCGCVRVCVCVRACRRARGWVEVCITSLNNCLVCP